MSEEITLFTYLNCINKKTMTLEEAINYFKIYDYGFKNFNFFMLMRWLFSGDFIEEANKINSAWNLNKEQMFRFIYLNIPKNNKFIKYVKKEADDEKNLMLKYVCDYYKVNKEHAKQYLKFMNNDEKLNILKMFGLDEKEIKKILKGE